VKPLRARRNPQSVAYVVRSYPRLSQTFILDEILMLERRGVNLRIFALVDPREPIVQPEVGDVEAPVHYLEHGLERQRLALVAEHVVAAVRSPRRYGRALLEAWSHGRGDTEYAAATRTQCFLHAVHLSRLLRREARRTGVGTRHLHAHFAHDPTLVAMLAHTLTGITYSFTAHARDLYQVPVSVLTHRAERASGVVTCCRANADYLERTLPPRLRSKVRLVYHGVDLQKLAAKERTTARPGVPLILSVGRLVEKKGFEDLLLACHGLKQEGRAFECVIYGDGPQRDELVALAQRLHLSGNVSLPGARSRREIASAYLEADVFALTPFVTSDGDRDGIPNVLVEAMACGVPAVTTAAGGITELVHHDLNGLLAPPRSVPDITAHLAALLGDEDRRRRLGAAARRTVQERFDAQTAAGQLVELFEGVMWRHPDLQAA
jgi:glycosyltransferase involved in cell wall biosynthesis